MSQPQQDQAPDFSDLDFSTPSLPHRAYVAMSRALRDPRLAPELAIKFLRRKIFGARNNRRTNEYATYKSDMVSAVHKLTDTSPEQASALLQEESVVNLRSALEARRIELGLRGQTYGGNVDLVYLICRILKPKVVIETGVAFGWTSSYILQALETNGSGHLHSIDLPPMRNRGEEMIGTLIPEHLKKRWTLYQGPQTRLLPNLLKTEKEIGFAHYDSDKTYHGMKWGYETLWRNLTSGGILMSDDLWNDAFLDFADSVGKKPIIVESDDGAARVGLLKID